ncbi:alkaline phosphatase D family protein [Haloarchaeobius sp. HRN-SO-5]|uniref:alkaline phosphatase D family protein n=1 Tax=Haloarchaeobius sp. HRN-SO-5 TaxID=3446118 RepID=UPI003EBE1B42
MTDEDWTRVGDDEELDATGGHAERWSPTERTMASDHDELSSLLSRHDLAFARDPKEPDDPSVFEFDPAADADETFPQSIASGGPTTNGVILWTRIAPEEFDPESPLAVEVADDESFETVVHRGVLSDSDAIEAHDYTVKVDLDGVLEPGRTYYYRFVYRSTASRVGRCRTLPAADASPDELSFVVLTCQNYANGYYPAYDYVAEEDVDFVVHVGDFIYESADGHFKSRFAPSYPGREKDLPSGNGRVETEEDYRYLYRTYKSDRFLQRALERHTLIPAWDDHEIANDIYWDYEDDAPKADHPKGDDPEFMTRLAADAMHVWWEYMPARINYDPDATQLQDRFTLWRSLQFGDLVSLVMTDERLFRTGERDMLLPTRRATAPEREPPDHTMLGPDQLEWFLDEITAADRETKWNVWSDEVLTIPFRLGAGPATLYPVQGGWDGYQSERQYLTNALAARDVENFVTITGDMHCYVAGYQQTEYRDAVDTRLAGPVDEDKRIGVEFMTPALTSLNVAEALGLTQDPWAKPTERLLRRLVTAQNPHIEFFDSHHWGYSVVTFTREDCTYVGYSVDKSVNSSDAPREVIVAMRVPDGEVRLEDVTDEYQ